MYKFINREKELETKKTSGGATLPTNAPKRLDQQSTASKGYSAKDKQALTYPVL